MTFLMKLLITACCLLVLLAACTPERTYHVTEGHTHTYYRITYLHDRSLDREITDEIQRFYHSLNPFDSLSIVSAVNMNRDVEVDSIFIHAFRVAEEVSRQTEGMFDITCAPLINAWGFGFKNMGRVTPALIDSLKSFVGYEKVRLEGSRVVKDDPRIMLNFSAVGDGCICDLIATRLDSLGIDDYLVDIGGEMTAKGVNPKGLPWHIGINKPVDDSTQTNNEIQQIIELSDRRGIATSGDYRNFYVRDGRKYAHTINPKTGYPAAADILSATIMARDCIVADAYATSCMALGREEAKKLLARHPELEYYFIYADSTGTFRTEYSPGMEKYLVK